MTAPHFHTSSEAKAAIKKIEHNSGQAAEGAPTGIAGGSARNQTTTEKGVTSATKGDDWVNHRGLRGAGGSAGRGE